MGSYQVFKRSSPDPFFFLFTKMKERIYQVCSRFCLFLYTLYLERQNKGVFFMSFCFNWIRFCLVRDLVVNTVLDPDLVNLDWFFPKPLIFFSSFFPLTQKINSTFITFPHCFYFILYSSWKNDKQKCMLYFYGCSM